ncbi:interleukin-17 receptor B [Lepus europaeus]|uniref:interleukin-17 receptor B n=1 Tax=Lepus europaeus TaxID=9983 RepID=UPI002B491D0C|nr:interleukin-17 receptor B [Lepus europaeus]
MLSLVLLSLAALCRNALPRELTVQCGSETGPSPEWLVRHTLTPGDLRDLRVEPVTTKVAVEDYSVLMNISWVLRADASILVLKATKICVTGKSSLQSYSCVRCNYTEAFQSQTRPSGHKWAFSYVGFPMELNTLYFIGAHNIPNANMNGEGPSLSVNFTSPGCLDHIMRYKKKCIEAGSLWDPNITACKKNETTVLVKFTTSLLGNKYMALVRQGAVIGFSTVLEDKLTRTSVEVPVRGESHGAVVQLTPYFRTCGNDCIRHQGTVVLCPQPDAPSLTDTNRSVLGSWLPLLLPPLLVAVWVLAAGIYLRWRHDRTPTVSFPATTLLPRAKVLVVYPSEVCFHHTVCGFTEFLQSHCGSEVILDKWQQKKVAELGPVLWLTTEKQAADRVIFLPSNEPSTQCGGACAGGEGGPHRGSQDLFALAYNLLCSDLGSQTHACKYLVVYFSQPPAAAGYSALRLCPQFHLWRDAAALRTQLLRVTQQGPVGTRS